MTIYIGRECEIWTDFDYESGPRDVPELAQDCETLDRFKDELDANYQDGFEIHYRDESRLMAFLWELAETFESFIEPDNEHWFSDYGFGYVQEDEMPRLFESLARIVVRYSGATALAELGRWLRGIQGKRLGWVFEDMVAVFDPDTGELAELSWSDIERTLGHRTPESIALDALCRSIASRLASVLMAFEGIQDAERIVLGWPPPHALALTSGPANLGPVVPTGPPRATGDRFPVLACVA